MNLDLAERKAQRVLDEHGLSHWNFKWDNAVARAGQTRYRSQTISMSKKIVSINNEDMFMDTLLHEVAHALVGPGKGHGAVWKRKVAQIGGKPSRCYDASEVETPEYRYRVVCSNCGMKSGRHRKTKNLQACTRCCNKYNGGKFTTKFLITWIDTKQEA